MPSSELAVGGFVFDYMRRILETFVPANLTTSDHDSCRTVAMHLATAGLWEGAG